MVISERTNCVDVGCHKGEILKEIVKLAPKGKHYAFEPIPDLYNTLLEKYGQFAKIYPYALSSRKGSSEFQLVKNDPAYSGLKRRRYSKAKPLIEEITVEMRTLDETIPKELDVGFIKIDVEGGEFDVIEGAKDLLKRCKPVIIFEFGKGASEYYGTRPSDIFLLISKEIGLKISTLKAFINDKKDLNIEEFIKLYDTNKEYYFVAHK